MSASETVPKSCYLMPFLKVHDALEQIKTKTKANLLIQNVKKKNLVHFFLCFLFLFFFIFNLAQTPLHFCFLQHFSQHSAQ